MSAGIYLVRDDGKLVEMTEQPYESESLLQELLEAYPGLLSAERDRGDYGTDWLTVVRQTSLSLEEDRIDRWSLDRLFLDRDGVPTLVDIDCSSDSHVRSEAIGHLLNYAANLSSYWSLETMLAQFEANCRETGRDPEQIFEDFIGPDEDEERFWQQVKTNLQAGKIRLVVVSNEVSPALGRIVEFLNEQMDPAELIAIEIKQYASPGGFKNLVPRSIGRTAEASKKKAPAALERRRWDEASFFQEFELRQGEDEAAIATRIYRWCQEHEAIDVVWRTGDSYGGFMAQCDLECSPSGGAHELFKVGIDGGFEIVSSAYASWKPFRRADDWTALRNRLSAIGLALPPNPTERRSPNFSLSTLRDPVALQKVFETFDWILETAATFGDREGTGRRPRPDA